MLNQEQVSKINSLLENYTCPICGGKHFSFFPEKQQFIWNNDGAPTNTVSPCAMRLIVAACDTCGFTLNFKTDF